MRHPHRAVSRPTRRDDRGASAVEYALIVFLIAAVIFGTVAALGLATFAMFGSVEFP